ncbi:hypothetical protein AGMMS50268_21950 [Spirochaetia bacterium]|nr:hypothetical protein AGMMS50268_21950 [Spirochaetia bacterium]
MKRFPALTLLLVSVIACGSCSRFPNREAAGVEIEETHTLKVVTNSAYSLRAVYAIADRFIRDHPSFTVEASAVAGTAPINVFLTSKFAVGDAPDIFIYQAGSSTRLFAQGGHLLDLSDQGFEERFVSGTDESCRYQGRLYALPMDISISGLFVQMSVLWRGYIKNNDLRVVPRTIDEFIESCEKLRRAGIEYPVVISAANDTAAANFLYQYIHQNIYAENPHFYEDIIRGRRKWTDGEFQEMYRMYERLRPYMNPDAVRIDNGEAIRRFAEGEAAYYIGLSRDIAAIRKIQPDLDMLLVTPPWKKEAAGTHALSGVDTVVSGSGATPYPDEVIAFLRELSSAEGADLYIQAASSISAVRDSYIWYDPCLGPQNDVFKESPFSEFISRQWLPGFEDLFRRLNQEWFTGRPADSILEELERLHQQAISLNGAMF